MNTAVKSEQLDVFSLDSADNVKNEGSDVRDEVSPLDTAAMVKQEVDIGPTVVQTPDITYMMLPCKADPENNISQMESHGLGNVINKDDNSSVTRTCEVQYFCNVCSKSFILKSVFQRHLLTHTSEDYDNLITKLLFKKNTSNVSETSNCTTVLETISLNLHTDTGTQAQSCGVCNKTFSDKSIELARTSEQPYCDVCKKKFIQKSTLESQILTHSDKRPHRCDICNKNFSQKSHLKTHTLTHTGERPHQCDVCNKKFSKKSDLKTHTLTHTGKKPNHCDFCNKNFSRKSTFKTHMLIHTGEQPHQCDACNKTFSQRGHLKRHMLTHNGERSHRCDVCTKGFALKDSLKKHMLIHTGEKPHRCPICNKSFSMQSNMKIHMSTLHK